MVHWWRCWKLNPSLNSAVLRSLSQSTPFHPHVSQKEVQPHITALPCPLNRSFVSVLHNPTCYIPLVLLIAYNPRQCFLCSVRTISFHYAVITLRLRHKSHFYCLLWCIFTHFCTFCIPICYARNNICSIIYCISTFSAFVFLLITSKHEI